MQIETIANCNMFCSFCPYSLKEDKSSKLPSELVFNIVSEINPKSSNFEYLCFSQFNEPLLDNRIFEFIRFAKDKDIPILLITNGLLLSNKDIIQRLIDTSPDYLKISVQTVGEESFNQIRRIKLDYQKYIKGIYNFLSAVRNNKIQVTVDLGCNFLSPKKIKVIKKRILGLSRGDPSVPDTLTRVMVYAENFLSGLMESDRSFSVDIRKSLNTMRDCTPAYLDEKGIYIADNTVLKVKPFTYGHKLKEYYPYLGPFSCQNRILGILANGTVVPCCLLYDGSISLGNIHLASLSDILKNSESLIKNLHDYNNNKSDICRRCMGEPTLHGALIRSIYHRIKSI